MVEVQDTQGRPPPNEQSTKNNYERAAININPEGHHIFLLSICQAQLNTPREEEPALWRHYLLFKDTHTPTTTTAKRLISKSANSPLNE
jgi:hypothetical protein